MRLAPALHQLPLSRRRLPRSTGLHGTIPSPQRQINIFALDRHPHARVLSGLAPAENLFSHPVRIGFLKAAARRTDLNCAHGASSALQRFNEQTPVQFRGPLERQPSFVLGLPTVLHPLRLEMQRLIICVDR